MSPRQARTVALVVTYNRKELLRQCLICLAEQQGIRPDILVIDNASTDGTEEMVASLSIPGLQYCNTGANLGGAGGFAFAVRQALCAGYETLWLMDDDTFPEPTALKALYEAEAALQGNFGWLSSRALSPQGKDQPMNRQRKTPYRDIELSTSETFVPAVMASFVSLYLHADTVEQFGLPIAEFFIWSDDWEFTRRISKQKPCYYVPASRVVHAMQQATVVNIAKDTPERWPRYRYFYRNDVYLYRREGLLGWLWLLFKDSWHSLQILVSPGKRKLHRLAIVWSGFLAGISFHPTIQPCQRPKGV